MLFSVSAIMHTQNMKNSAFVTIPSIKYGEVVLVSCHTIHNQLSSYRFHSAENKEQKDLKKNDETLKVTSFIVWQMILSSDFYTFWF